MTTKAGNIAKLIILSTAIDRLKSLLDAGTPVLFILNQAGRSKYLILVETIFSFIPQSKPAK